MTDADLPSRFHLETDASLNPGQRKVVAGVSFRRAGGGIVLRSPGMEVVGIVHRSSRVPVFDPHAEALVLLRGIRVARQRHGATVLRVRTDSAQLVELVTRASEGPRPRPSARWSSRSRPSGTNFAGFDTPVVPLHPRTRAAAWGPDR